MSDAARAVVVLKEHVREHLSEAERCIVAARYHSDPLQAANCEHVAWACIRKAQAVTFAIQTLRPAAARRQYPPEDWWALYDPAP